MNSTEFYVEHLREWRKLKQDSYWSKRKLELKFEELKELLKIHPVCQNTDVIESELKAKIADEVLKS